MHLDTSFNLNSIPENMPLLTNPKTLTLMLHSLTIRSY